MGVDPQPAKGEFDRMGLAGDQRQLPQGPLDQRAGRHEIRGKGGIGAGEKRKAGQGEQILDRNRNAHQRAQITALRQKQIGGLRLIQRPRPVPAFIGVEIAPLMGGYRLAHQCPGLQLARAKFSEDRFQ